MIAGRNWRPWALAALVACLPAGASAVMAAEASSVTWVMLNRTPLQAQVIFFSQTRQHQWPDNGRAYQLFDNKQHKITLACEKSERICYGGFTSQPPAHSWGVGQNNDRKCTTCCATCGDAEPVKRALTQ